MNTDHIEDEQEQKTEPKQRTMIQSPFPFDGGFVGYWGYPADLKRNEAERFKAMIDTPVITTDGKRTTP